MTLFMYNCEISKCIKLKWFSQRKGFKSIKTKLQIDTIDDDLKNRLWNVLKKYYWNRGSTSSNESLLILLWDNYFKRNLDDMGVSWHDKYGKLRSYFFHCEWHEVYSFLEFIVNNHPNTHLSRQCMDLCNSILEEVSAYRFAGGFITQITSKEEISEIEEALTTPLKPVNVHLKTALELLSDKKSPDYRNSIKESISAVESICNLITGDKNLTLGQCLNKIEEKIPMHRALEQSFSSLYGYTSSANGIRHALLDEATLEFEDAKFMLVSCSAFINYLKGKSSKAGITF